MKMALAIILIMVLAGLLAQVYFIFKEKSQLQAKILDLGKRFDFLKEENEAVKSEIEYFSHPANLEKELREKFNYRKPDEKMIIVVP
ncbi:hypothetical protein HZB06_00320 [Candidatus Wolfebacteria bacterium]|nr:hypothetical protein [Candidatus Wolfebacteria bacterium]